MGVLTLVAPLVSPGHNQQHATFPPAHSLTLFLIHPTIERRDMNKYTHTLLPLLLPPSLPLSPFLSVGMWHITHTPVYAVQLMILYSVLQRAPLLVVDQPQDVPLLGGPLHYSTLRNTYVDVTKTKNSKMATYAADHWRTSTGWVLMAAFVNSLRMSGSVAGILICSAQYRGPGSEGSIFLSL